MNPADVSMSEVLAPVVKWAGGKRRLLGELCTRLPQCYGRYHEPFVGGGALFFALQMQCAWLCDRNAELMDFYATLRDHCEELLLDLGRHENRREYFMALRDLDRRADFALLPAVKRASRFLYLNHACFNGLYRVNARGQFNVPFGRYAALHLPTPDHLRRCAQLLARSQLCCDDFTAVLTVADKGDLVYLDPPYASDSGGFTAYVPGGFDEEDQRRLRQVCDELSDRGVYVMLSNADVPLVRELYADYDVEQVQVRRSISAAGSGRRRVSEVVVRNYAGSGRIRSRGLSRPA